MPKGHYCRLFEPSRAPLSNEDEEKLVRLGESMRYTVEREGTLTPRVGFTYFGQFVGHDLTRDVTPLAGPYLDPEQTPNYHTHYFDLEQIYGGGPSGSPHLYEGNPGSETFKIGRTEGYGYPRDIPIEEGRLAVADRRDVDNLILRQLHVVFLKFHNEAIRQLSARPATITGTENSGQGTLFDQAQRLVRWHYQWIIRHDYLPRILDPRVWRFRSKPALNGKKAKSALSIPIEFSLGAFRFGHSMVRTAYGLNCRKKRVEISELMAIGHEALPLPDDYLVEWGRFFDGLPASGPVASSAFIDTAIVSALHNLPEKTIRLCNETETDSRSEPISLPVRTLLRGARAGLPSGQEVAAALVDQKVIRSRDCLTTDQLTADGCDKSGSMLRKVGLEKDTPLFYYLLKEAELLAGGKTLGPIGSFIVARVVQGALEGDPDGYVSGPGRNWALPTWRFPDGTDKQANSLIAIIRLIGETQLLPECNERVQQLLKNFLHLGR